MVKLGLGYVHGDDCLRLLRDRARERHDRKEDKKEARRSASRNDVPGSVKKRVKRRDKRCRWCGTNEALEVHHISYRSELGGHEETNLITLCFTCHKTAHGNKRHWQPILRAVIWRHYVDRVYATVPETKRWLQRRRIIT